MTRVVDLAKLREQSAYGGRYLGQLQRGFGNDAKRSFRSDERSEQVVAWLIQSEIDNLAACKHDTATEHVVRRGPILQTVNATGAFGDVSADRAARLARRIGNVIQTVRSDGARRCRYARDETERKKLWAARKGAFGAIGRISPDSMIQDAVVPRSHLPEVLGAAYDIAARYQLRIANVFHAGDGNLHPLICFDSRHPDEVLRVREAGRELMEVCVKAGGTITGEHGVGLDKRELLPLVFSEADMNAMLSVRAAFDPLGLCNPGKIVPMLRGCGEGKAVSTSANAPAETQVYRVPIDRETRMTRIVGDASIASEGSAPIVFPTSIEQICEIVKLAAHERWTIQPTGSMTWLKSAESAAPLIVSTRRLNEILEHEPADLIAIAQAGVKLTDFNAKLEENGQWLPLDPPDDGRATLGGVVATGLGGPQQFGYGRPRGSVIGMKVVLADGTVIKAGGRVVKNVAGYDLCKLFTGSFGTLGIITELNFKLRPRPEREATVVVKGELPDLLSSARTILDARLFPVAAEIIDKDPRSPVLLIRFAGNDKGVTYQIEQALARLKNAEVISDDRKLWKDVAAGPSMSALIPQPVKKPLIELNNRVKRQLDPMNIFPQINADDTD